jgi:hypothetical protein
MEVPEASMSENRGPVFRQNEIGLARQTGTPESVAKSKPVQRRAQNQLRLGVSSGHAGHELGALLRREDISHRRVASANRQNVSQPEYMAIARS